MYFQVSQSSKQILQKLSPIEKAMQRQTEIIDLTDFTKEEILERIQQILESSYIQKFTLLLKRQVRQSRTEKKLEKKENCIENIKQQFSTATNNLSVERETNLGNKLITSGLCGLGLKVTSSYIRGHDKKYSKVSSHRSRQASRTNSSIFNVNCRLEDLPHSLQLYYEGEYQLALMEFFDQERQLKKKMNESPQSSQYEQHLSEYAKLMINIGNCYFCEKDYEKAMKFYKKEIQSPLVDEKLIGQKYNNLGSCYAHTKQNQQALKSFNQALKIYAKYPDLDCSNLLKNIGVIYFRSGMYSTAEPYFQQSINQRKVKSPSNQEALLSTYYKLGLCQKRCHKPQQAINNLLFALNISEKGYPLLSEILKELADIYESQQKFSEALLYCEKLSDQCQRKNLCQGQIYQKVATIHQKQGNCIQHDKFMRLALSQYRKFNQERKVSKLTNPRSEPN